MPRLPRRVPRDRRNPPPPEPDCLQRGCIELAEEVVGLDERDVGLVGDLVELEGEEQEMRGRRGDLFLHVAEELGRAR
jgi:hypothetical protein